MTNHNPPCRHVYENIGVKVCPYCGLETHETDWAYQNQLAKEWRIQNPDAVKYGGWWSI